MIRARTLQTLILVLALGCVSPAERAEEERKLLQRARTHHDFGANHLAEGRVELAIRELREAIELRPEDRWSHLHLALAYRAKGYPDDALDHLRQALTIDPDFHEARLTLSGLLIESKRYEEAAVECERLLNDPTFPAPWRALTNVGWARFKLGHHPEARQNLELALEYSPEYWRALLNLGILEEEEGRRVEAMERFEQVLESRAGPLARAETEFRIAEIYIGLGQREKAVKHLSAATEYEPSGEWGKRSKKYLKLLR